MVTFKKIDELQLNCDLSFLQMKPYTCRIGSGKETDYLNNVKSVIPEIP
jgi:hypothetical protein